MHSSLVLIVFSSFGLVSAYVPDISTDLRTCLCVPYWQCKEDFSGPAEDTHNVADVRTLRNVVRPTDCMGDFDVCCKMECGRRNTGNTVTTQTLQHTYYNVMTFPVLDEDNEAAFGEFPWMLGIFQNGVFRCGASLIHPKIALTAAHCVSAESIYEVRAGEWNLQSLEEPIPHQDRTIKKVTIHHYYDPSSLANDIALLLLESPFIITDGVGVICLPKQEVVHDYVRCIATGWGKHSVFQQLDQFILKKVELPIIPNDQCLVTLQNAQMGPFFMLHKSFMCAGGEGKDTCSGDGGSPLVCPINGQPGRYEQVGIVTWGLTCGVAYTPGVYVNVALFDEWIQSSMEQLLSNNY